jgi:hypothetical protein
MTAENRRTTLVAAGIFLLNIFLNAPLFLPGEGKYRDSIEGGYASMAHFISKFPNPFGWNPIQYGGLPTHDWYLPVVPYLSALWIKLFFFLKPEHVYRLVVTTMACAVPATVFLLAYSFVRSRKWALFAAIGFTLWSPSYGLYWAINWDRGITYLPWRMQILAKYGEGPHSFGLALIPIALIAVWRAATGRRFSQLLAAAALLAIVPLTNWIAGLSLAWCVLMMLFAGFGTGRETGFLSRRVLYAGALAYLFACFWLTPSFIVTTLFNWPADAFNYKLQAQQWQLAEGLLAAVVLVRLIFLFFRGSHYLCFVSLCFTGFAWVVTGHYWYHIDMIPESRRYAVEFELFFFLLLVDLWRTLVESTRRLWFLIPRDFAVVGMTWLLYYGALQPLPYFPASWIFLRPQPRAQTVEYKISEFLAGQKPEGRVFVSGGTRFRLNSWFLIPQMGGTFESGLSNRAMVHLLYRVRTGKAGDPARRAEESLLLLQAAGVEYLAVHPKDSGEHWKDFANPETLEGLLQPVFRDVNDVVYKVPFHGMAHLVRKEELPPGLPIDQDVRLVEPFVRAIADPMRPALELNWRSNNEFNIHGPMPEGSQVSVLVAWNSGWSAEQDGKEVPVRQDKLGYILVSPDAKPISNLRLRYHAPWEQKLLTAVSLIAIAAALRRWNKERKA